MARVFGRDPGTIRFTADDLARLPLARNEFFGEEVPYNIFGSALRAWYRNGYDPSTGIWQDSVGGNDGVAPTGRRPTTATTPAGNTYLVFDGSSTGVNLGDVTYLDGLSDFTVWFAFKGPTQNPYGTILGKAYSSVALHVGASDIGDVLWAESNTIGSDPARSDGDPFDDTWRRGVWVQTNGTGRLYVDGVLQADTQAGFAIADVLEPLTIGAVSTDGTTAWDYFFTGGIGNLGIAARSSSSAEVASLDAMLDAWVGSTVSPATATSDISLGKVGLIATAAVRAAASATPTLGPLAGTSTAAVRVAASATPTFGALAASASAVVPVVGSSAFTLGVLAASASAGVAVSASLARTLGALTGTSTATALAQATCTAALGSLALTANAAVGATVTATLDRTVGPLGLASTAGALASASCAPTLGTLSLTSATASARAAGSCAFSFGLLGFTGTATSLAAASASLTLGSLVASGTATVRVTASSSVTLGGAALAAASAVRVSGSLTQTLGFLTVTGSATNQQIALSSAAFTLGAFGVSATATARVSASASPTLGDHRVAGTTTTKISASADLTVGGVRSSGTVATTISASGSFALGVQLTGTARVPVVASVSAGLAGLQFLSTAILPPDVVVGELAFIDAELASLSVADVELAALAFGDEALAVLTFGVRAEPYDVGDTAKVTMTFTVDGVPTNPTTVTLEVYSPSGVTTSVTSGFQIPSTGVFEYLLDLIEDGTWSFFGQGTGAAKCAQPHDLFVRAKPF